MQANQYKYIVILMLIVYGCSKDQTCRDFIEFPRFSGNDEPSSIEGMYAGKEVCIYDGMGTYTARTLAGNFSKSDPSGGNFVTGYHNGTIILNNPNPSHSLPTIAIKTPLLEVDPESKLSYYEKLNERIQFFNSKKNWKVGLDRDNTYEEYLSIFVNFNCDEIAPADVTYGIYFHTANEQLRSDDYIKVEKFEMEEKDGMIHYDIVFDINIYLYSVNCALNCKEDKLEVKWKSSFSLPVK